MGVKEGLGGGLVSAGVDCGPQRCTVRSGAVLHRERKWGGGSAARSPTPLSTPRQEDNRENE
jgi:hypothetical protein